MFPSRDTESRCNSELRTVYVLGKLPWGRLDLMSLAILIVVLPGESILGTRWWSEEKSHDERNLTHHLVLGRRKRGSGNTILGVDQPSQFEGEFSKLGLDDIVQNSRALGVPSVWVQSLRHQTVLLDKVVHHIPLATVRDYITQQVLDKPTFEVFSSSINDLFKEPVGLLKFIPVEKILLRQLKTLKVISLHEGNAENVCRSKEPAAAARALIRDGISFKRDLDVEYLLVRNLGWQ
ncbi:hypothetical protein HG531_005072 [Fusarium graminearum]|nr:hypothetical protein HG531_005072 [Fusarium graminearum]